ncbi:PREDICTED: gibberellin 3-beta-dioxygenase 4 [Camelina sativa]|uniref:Gibberellin 3-beta-dioxygenase 4 n=1 Tax=Camelina sativa TaxID=90675 RepID=A0ABM0TR32_CAMSA|nr:PREDICTED: gibberellin 3-beta-dioxygenase 4 [Camelina sativa]
MPPIAKEICIGNLGNLQTLPDSFTWELTSADSVIPPSSAAVKESIPVIDLSDPDHVTTNLIGNACHTWGAFQIANHGISQKLLDEIESLSKTLFDMPSEKKLETASSEKGVSGYGEPRISSFFEKKMWSEGFTIADGSYRNHFITLWPHDHINNCRIIEEYKDEMEKLANRLMSSILGSLGVTVDDIEWGQKPGNSGSKVGRGAIRLNHYPVCPEPERAMGLAAHTDTTILTILHQSNTGGLQVFREESGWVNVEPSPGILVVNIGDLFHILSNGKIPSVVHRAKVNHTRSRISIAYLWCGPAGDDVEIKPIPKIIGPVGQSLYRSVTWKEYLQIKYKVFDKAFDAIRTR